MVLVPASMLQDDARSNIVDIYKHLPKQYQKKAKTILISIGEQLKVNDQKRVISKNGTQGSHIVHFKYYLTPKHIKTERPSDAVKFGQLMLEVGVPNSSLNRPIEENTKLPAWDHVFIHNILQ